MAMELVILAPFMKLAHAIYRPVALFFLALAGAPAGEPGKEAVLEWLARHHPHRLRPGTARATSAKPAKRQGGLR